MNIIQRLLIIPFKVPRKLRAIFYRPFNRYKFWVKGIKFGRNMEVTNKVYVALTPGSRVTIGDNFLFTSGENFNPLCRNLRGSIFTETSGARIEIGDNVGMSSTTIWCKTRVTIGNNVKIGGDVTIMDTDAHSLDYRIRRSGALTPDGFPIDSMKAKSAPIEIGDDVLIGTRCIILKGVKIGARCVIGSGSIVTKDIPEDSIAAGNPCRVVKRIGAGKPSVEDEKSAAPQSSAYSDKGVKSSPGTQGSL